MNRFKMYKKLYQKIPPPNVEQYMDARQFGFNEHFYLTRRQPLLNQDNSSYKS